ncbi:MAG TPA: GNAT family N-acetyltransferase [Ignavibacteria bacterium]|nr:GNAT family N-acetyltransferase [Ignavibacteria bacterium]
MPANNEFKLRRAVQNDNDQIRQLFYDTINNINVRDYSSEQIKLWSSGYLKIDRWKKSIAEQYFIVSESYKIVTGFASITDKGYLDFMYVHKDHQGKGIASAMLAELESFADSKGIKDIWAQVSITSRPFFKSKGFEITKEFITKIEDIEFADAVMTKYRA